MILENEYIMLCVAPEIGGKLYYCTDKITNYNFIYKNNVTKPSNIGMTGAWVSGGIEWCVLHHHRASSFQNMDYDLQLMTYRDYQMFSSIYDYFQSAWYPRMDYKLQ